MGFENSLCHVRAGIDFSLRLRIQEAPPQKGQPLLLHFDNAIARQAGTCIEFHRDRSEKTPPREYSPLEVCKKGINQRPELL